MFLPGESQGRGSWWAAVYGVAQSRTRLKRHSSSSRLISTSQTKKKIRKCFWRFKVITVAPGPGLGLGSAEPRAGVSVLGERCEPRRRKLVWPLPRAAPAPGPPPRGIGGPPLRPASRGPREAPGRPSAWQTFPGPRVLGVAARPRTSAYRLPRPRGVLGREGAAVGVRRRAWAGSLLTRWVLTF